MLGSLENGYLVGRKDHEGAERYYQYCTAFPVGTALCTVLEQKLMEQFGRKVAAEMEEFHINLLACTRIEYSQKSAVWKKL